MKEINAEKEGDRNSNLSEGSEGRKVPIRSLKFPLGSRRYFGESPKNIMI